MKAEAIAATKAVKQGDAHAVEDLPGDGTDMSGFFRLGIQGTKGTFEGIVVSYRHGRILLAGEPDHPKCRYHALYHC